MTTLSNIGSVLSGLLSNSATAGTGITILQSIGTHMQGNAATNSSLASLLEQMQANPANAATYAALIAALPNVPGAVLTEINGAVALASDHTAYVEAIIRAKAALNTATSTSSLGGILAGLTPPAA